jgi:hypothetical protein
MSSKVLDFQQQQQLLLIPLANKRFAHVRRSISFWTFVSQQAASAAGPACFLVCLLAVSATAHLLQQHSSSNPSSSLRFFEPVWQAFILRCLLHSHDSTNTCSIFTCPVIITPAPQATKMHRSSKFYTIANVLTLLLSPSKRKRKEDCSTKHTIASTLQQHGMKATKKKKTQSTNNGSDKY